MNVQTKISYFDQVLTEKMLENIEETFFSIRYDGEGFLGEKFYSVGDSQEVVKIIPNETRLGEFIKMYSDATVKSKASFAREDFEKAIDNIKSEYRDIFKV